MKRKLKQCWSSIPPISTKWTITSHLNSLNTKKYHNVGCPGLHISTISYGFWYELNWNEPKSVIFQNLNFIFHPNCKAVFFANVDLIYESLKLWINTENEIFFSGKGTKRDQNSYILHIWKLKIINYSFFPFIFNFKFLHDVHDDSLCNVLHSSCKACQEICGSGLQWTQQFNSSKMCLIGPMILTAKAWNQFSAAEEKSCM